MTDAPRRALIVIDVQNEYFTGHLQIEFPPSSQSLAHIGRIMDAATGAGVPVIVIQQHSPAGAPAFAEGSDGWRLHEAVAQRHRDAFFQKPMPSAFTDTGLAEWLQSHAIDTLTVVGYMTHNCNDTTIKHAFDAGLQVEFLMDASGSVSYANRAGFASAEEIHRVFSVVEQSRYAAVLDTDEWIGCVTDHILPERDTIHASHQRALASQGTQQVA